MFSTYIFLLINNLIFYNISVFLSFKAAKLMVYPILGEFFKVKREI
jgi:hypothetical protein